MKNKSLLISFFILCITAIKVNAQFISTLNFSINDGLPSNAIKAIYKDSRGLLWLGTDNGLCSYDGIKFKVYDEINKQKTNSIWAIAEDINHNLWLSIYGRGLAKFDGKKFTYYDKSNGLVNNAIRKLYYSTKYQCLIIGTENGLSVFDGKTFKSFTGNITKNKFQILGINEWNNQTLITTRYNGVYSLKLPSSNIVSATLDSSFNTEICFSGFIDNNLYFGGSGEHHFFTKDLINNTETKYPSPVIWDYAKTSNNDVYMAGWDVITVSGGLFQYSNGQYANVSKQTNVNSTSIWSLFYDKESNVLWVGTLDKGLYKLTINNQIDFLNSTFFGVDKLEIKSLFNDANNNIWIGADNNIIRLKPDKTFDRIDKATLSKKIISYQANSNQSNYWLPQPKIDNGFTSFNFTADNQKNVWLATSWGLVCFDENLTIKHFRGADGGHVAIDRNQQLYYGEMYSTISICANPFAGNKIKELKFEDKSTPTDINKILVQDNKVWYGTISKGLFVSQDTVFHKLNLPENYIRDLAITSNQNILIGANNGKAFLGKLVADTLQIIKQYLPEKDIYGSTISFVDETNGIKLISTNRGINVLKNDSLVTLINQAEGLPQLPYLCSVKDNAGNVFIATENGLVTLNANNILSSTAQHNLTVGITSIKINGQSLHDSLFSWNEFNNTKLSLSYNQNDIEILFAQNNTFNASKNVYRYKIVGLSNSWSDYESVGKIVLKGLSNGSYTIVLEGKNLGTGEVFKSKNFILTIHPPFWKTYWFIILALLAIGIFSYLYFRYRIKAVQEKAQLSNKLLAAQLEAQRSQMNPHFTFNAINSIQNFIIDNDTKNALRYLSEFSKLIRQTLESATQQLTPLHTEISFLKSYIEVQKMRFDNVSASIVIDDAIDEFKTFIPPLIIQPFIENAFEHAFQNSKIDNKIVVGFNHKNDIVICTIKDNGIGINNTESNPKHQSKGLTITQERLALLNKEYNTKYFTLAIQNLNTVATTETGTLVTLTFPKLTSTQNQTK